MGEQKKIAVMYNMIGGLKEKKKPSLKRREKSPERARDVISIYFQRAA